MAIENRSSRNITTRWNEYMQTYMVDAELNCGLKNIGAIREGTQHYKGNIKSVTTLVQPCSRTPCDLKDADIIFTDTQIAI